MGRIEDWPFTYVHKNGERSPKPNGKKRSA